MWTVTTLFLLRVLNDLVLKQSGGSYQGALSGIWCGLYKPPTSPITQYSTMAGITEANYDGYSRQAVVWFPPWQSTGGPEILAAQDLWYSPTDALVSNQITGVFLADAFYGGNLLAAAVVPNPGVQLSGPATAMKVQPQYQLPFTQIYGSPAIVS
jgi:hypothetical protein